MAPYSGRYGQGVASRLIFADVLLAFRQLVEHDLEHCPYSVLALVAVPGLALAVHPQHPGEDASSTHRGEISTQVRIPLGEA